jgi:inosine/xanthosine triphosphate pyrophosphatase family protein
MAELPPETKNQVSHRARASQKALVLLAEMVAHS